MDATIKVKATISAHLGCGVSISAIIFSQSWVEDHQNKRKQCFSQCISPVTPHIGFWWFKCITSNNSNVIESSKKNGLSSFWLLKNYFSLIIKILRVKRTVVWLKTPSKHCQPHQTMILGNLIKSTTILLMLLKLISKQVWYFLSSENDLPLNNIILKVNIAIV